MKAKEKATITAAPKRQSKDNHFATQMQITYQSFKEHPKTMLQVSIETGILRANICRYVKIMRESNEMQILKLGRCPISKRSGVQFLTTDKGLFNSQVKEPSLFDEL